MPSWKYITRRFGSRGPDREPAEATRPAGRFGDARVAGRVTGGGYDGGAFGPLPVDRERRIVPPTGTETMGYAFFWLVAGVRAMTEWVRDR